MPFSDVLRANKKFEWAPRYEEAYQDLKQHLWMLSPLAKPTKADTLFLYLSINPIVVTSVLVKYVGKVQVHVYYVSKALSKVEMNYMEV